MLKAKETIIIENNEGKMPNEVKDTEIPIDHEEIT